MKDHLPLPFNQWVDQLERQTRKLAKQGSKIHLNTIWQDTVVRQYKAAIKGKYPFSSRARKEVRLKDFGRFFGYGGTMDTFFTAYLEPFVDTSKRNWRFTKSIGVSKASLRAFEQARRIRDVFFLNLKVSFQGSSLVSSQCIWISISVTSSSNLVVNQ